MISGQGQHWLARLSGCCGVMAGCCGVMVCGCGSGLPLLTPLGSTEGARAAQACQSFFPRAPWRATHVVEATMPLGNGGSFIGAVAARPGLANFRTLLMSQEGFVLFDAEFEADHVEVVRALPPLDPEAFGRAMTGDVRLVLFPPGDAPTRTGMTSKGEKTCRYRHGQAVVDVVIAGKRQARILRFEDGSLERVAQLSEVDARGFAREAWLEAPGLVGYSLHLTLIDVEPEHTERPKSDPPLGIPAR